MIMLLSGDYIVRSSPHTKQQVIKVFRADEHGLRVFEPVISHKTRPKKTQRMQGVYPNIPLKYKRGLDKVGG